MTRRKYKGKKLRSTAQATNAPTVAGKILGGTKWYLRAFHQAHNLDDFASVIFPSSRYQEPVMLYFAVEPL